MQHCKTLQSQHAVKIKENLRNIITSAKENSKKKQLNNFYAYKIKP